MSKNIDELKKEILNKQKQSAKEKLPEIRNDGSDDKVVNLPNDNISALNTTAKGTVRNLSSNVAVLLQTDKDMKDLFALDVRTQRPIVTADKNIKLKGNITVRFQKGVLNDDAIAALSVFMSSRYGVQFTKQNLLDGMNTVAMNNQVNELADFMDDCYKNWDGKTRVDTFLPDFLGCEKCDFTTWATKKFFVSVVQKCYKPCENLGQFCMDLVGNRNSQGVGKTTLCRRMALCQFFGDTYYADTFSSFTDKDSLSIMAKALIVNDDEFVVSRHSDINDIKKIITSSFFEFRSAYASTSRQHYKGSMLMRCANTTSSLVDKTGNRRFLELLVNKDNVKKSVYEELTPEYIKQFYGEMTHYYKDCVLTGKYSLALSRDQLKQLTDLQLKKFTLVSDVEVALNQALVQLLQNGNDFFTLPEIENEVARVSNQTVQLGGKTAATIRNLLDNKVNFKRTRKRVENTRPHGYLFIGDDKTNVD